jgi:gluconolactonase
MAESSPPLGFRLGAFTIDLRARKLRRGLDASPLPARAFDALVYLVSHRVRAVDKDEIIAAVWRDVAVTNDSLIHAVSVLRRVLGDDAGHPTYIETIPRRGYRFIGPAEELVEPSPSVKSSLLEARDSKALGIPDAAAPIWRSWVSRPAIAAAVLLVAVAVLFLNPHRENRSPPRFDCIKVHRREQRSCPGIAEVSMAGEHEGGRGQSPRCGVVINTVDSAGSPEEMLRLVLPRGGFMRSMATLVTGLCLLGSSPAFAQIEAPRLPPAPADAPAPSVQAPADPGYAALVAMCKTPPPGRGGRAGGRGARGGPPAQPPGQRDYLVKEIPGVIAAGQKWTFVWQQAGNNGDGIVGTDDGGLLVAQNDSSTVLKLDRNGKPSIVYRDTHTGGSLSMSPKGGLFMVERGLRQRVEQLAPQRRVLAATYQGEPLDCIGGVINDLTADSKGGVYFTMGGLFHADAKGTVTRHGESLQTNGVILSPDEKTLYVTNVASIAAFDVQADGSLTNQREFAKLTAPGGDGLAVDSQGRLYVSNFATGVEVIGRDGTHLGVIPTPRSVITSAFGGTDKKTLYILTRGATGADGSEVANAAQVWTIPMIAQGYKGRAK